jgi:predicted Rossmann fold nucleotide-binding protein DprA/Smf involved in DNA uptake
MADAWGKIAETQKTLEMSFAALKQNFDEAEKIFKRNQAQLLAAFELQQKQQAAQLATIGKCLESIMGKTNQDDQLQV